MERLGKNLLNILNMSLSTGEKQQYSRNILLDAIGLEGQLKLKNAKVLVIGAGGLSCPVLQYLAAAGVGRIGVVDNDVVEQSNLQRQTLYTHSDIGKNKAMSAVTRLRLLNPYIQFNVYQQRLTKENALEIFKPNDIIVDGTDNFPTRYLINDTAILLNKCVVFGSIFKFEGQVSVFNYKHGPTYRCLYPTPPNPKEVLNCSAIGVLGVLPGIIGSFQANEVLKIILGLGNVLSGQLLLFDALSMKQSILPFKKNNEIRIKTISIDYQGFCDNSMDFKEITFQRFQEQSSEFNVLDVRTHLEREAFFIESMHIPLNELDDRYHEIPQDKNLLVYCKSGVRSKLAIKLLEDREFKKELMNLRGGISNQGVKIC